MGDSIFAVDIKEIEAEKCDKKVIQFAVTEGTNLGLLFKDETEMEEFVGILKGQKGITGEIKIGEVEQNENFLAYKDSIDVIPNTPIESTLNIQEYIYFYSMLRGSFSASAEELLDSILSEINMKQIKYEKISSLSTVRQMIVRSIAANMKNVKVIVFLDASQGILEEEYEVLRRMLKIYNGNGGICLFLSTYKDYLEKVTDMLYSIE